DELPHEPAVDPDDDGYPGNARRRKEDLSRPDAIGGDAQDNCREEEISIRNGPEPRYRMRGGRAPIRFEDGLGVTNQCRRTAEGADTECTDGCLTPLEEWTRRARGAWT